LFTERAKKAIGEAVEEQDREHNNLGNLSAWPNESEETKEEYRGPGKECKI
jgi:hypothetical protein